MKRAMLMTPVVLGVLLVLVWVAQPAVTDPAFPFDPLSTAPPPEALQIALTQRDLPPGFSLISQYADPYEIPVTGSGSTLAIGVCQNWSSHSAPYSVNNPGEIQSRFFVGRTRQEAALVLDDWKRTKTAQAPLRSDDHAVGDVAFGNYPGTTAFLLGRVVVILSVGTPNEADSSNLADSLVNLTLARLHGQGYAEGPPFQISASILQKHVKPRRGQSAAIVVQPSDAEVLPITCDYEVTRHGTPHNSVYHQYGVKSDSSGTVTVTWNGQTADGRVAPNGSYDVRITAEDLLGRVATAQVEDVVVNDP